MTDEQVVKAFECCKKIEEGCSHEYCFECPMFEEDVDECTASLFGKVLDLIKRQQAEIEDLIERLKEYKSFPCFTKDTQFVSVSRKADGQFTADKMIQVEVDKIRAEAYKEFAEKLLESKYESSDWSHGEHPYVVEESDIENLLYELTEGSNESE